MLAGGAALLFQGTVRADDTDVSMVDFAFQPADITIGVGDSVTWTNNGVAPHTATADDNSWDSGTIHTGETFTRTFDSAGTFTYHCSIHPNMVGTITVQEAPSTSTSTSTVTATATASPTTATATPTTATATPTTATATPTSP
ncbi:MAG: cupredoxin family copper-binding protein, partial [Hyphomicrobiales bacterium]